VSPESRVSPQIWMDLPAKGTIKYQYDTNIWPITAARKNLLILSVLC